MKSTYEENNVKQIINSLLPHEETRKLYLKMLVEAIRHADNFGSEKWGIYYLPNKIRLLVGSLIVFTINRNDIWLALDEQALQASENDRNRIELANNWRWDENDYPRYSAVPSRNGYYTPLENHLEIWPSIKHLHFEYISKVTDKYIKLKANSSAHGCLDLLSYLRSELEQDVPSPSYEQTEADDRNIFPEEISDDAIYSEGGKKQITVNAYERDSQARKACIAHYGTRCQVCKLDFGEKYGEIGKGFIHVHHLKPLSSIGESYRVDPKKDLAPVCPNCHAIIHRGNRDEPFTIEQVQGFLKSMQEASKC